MYNTIEHCGIAVLAAGESSRLGSPKQLLVYRGKSLLQHAVNVALQTTMYPVIVVVGANSDAVKKEIEGMNVYVVENERWREGMATSLCCGLAAVQKKNIDADGIIFMLCDQPFITPALLDSLLQQQKATGLPIVASSYENKLGTPALFHKSFFTELMKLSGDTGAAKLIKNNQEQVSSVAFPKGIIDIDTRTDYEALLQ